MGFKGTPETERAVSQTVDALLKCPRSREEHLIRKLRSLWNRRLAEIAETGATPSAALRAEIAKRSPVSTPSIRTTGPTLATEASSTVPTESDTETTPTVVTVAAPETTSPRERTSDAEKTST